MIFWSLVLMLIWIGLTGQIAWWNALLGLVIGVAIMRFGRREERERAKRKVWNVGYLVRLALVFLRDLIFSDITVLRACIDPRVKLEPAVIKIPLRIRGDERVMILANMISLTPGTLSLHVSEDQSDLIIHALFSGPESEKKLRRDIRQLEQLMVRVVKG